jgi:hypothetical protein
MNLSSKHPVFVRAVAPLATVVALCLLGGVAMAQEPAPKPQAPQFKLNKVTPRHMSKDKVQKLAAVQEARQETKTQKKQPARDFRWEGEELYYSVEISGTDAARASVRIGQRKTARGVTFVPVASDAVSHGFFAKSYPVNNRADTFVDVRTFQPIKADKVIRENGSERTYRVRYKPGDFTARVEKEMKEKGKKGKRNYERAVPASIHDGLSWMFDLRARPLKDGDVYTYYIYDGWKLSRLKAKVVGREKAWTPLKEYNAIKIDVEREILRSRWSKKTKKGRGAPKMSRREKPYYFSTIHLSDDENHVPVKIFVTSSKADSELKLVEYKAPRKT